MTRDHKIILVFVGFVLSIGIGFLLTKEIRDNQYEKARLYNTAIQADEKDRFNYAVDSRQGNVLGSGTFSAKEPVKIEDLSGEYFRISKNKERYTQHTRTYSCGTEEVPQTCTETYYTWDYAGGDDYESPILIFHDREYPTNMFTISVSRRVGCETILIDCKNGHRYENTGWWTSEGDIRWYYYVADTSFFGTILTDTREGTLAPVHASKITVRNTDIPTVLKEANNQIASTVFLSIWVLLTLGVCGFTLRELYQSEI